MVLQFVLVARGCVGLCVSVCFRFCCGCLVVVAIASLFMRFVCLVVCNVLLWLLIGC